MLERSFRVCHGALIVVTLGSCNMCWGQFCEGDPLPPPCGTATSPRLSYLHGTLFFFQGSLLFVCVYMAYYWYSRKRKEGQHTRLRTSQTKKVSKSMAEKTMFCYTALVTSNGFQARITPNEISRLKRNPPEVISPYNTCSIHAMVKVILITKCY